MLPLAWGVLGAGALSALGNYFGSKSSAKSASDAQAKSDAQNYEMFRQSRGSTGSAVLPEYLSGYESSLGQSAAEAAQALFGYGGGPQSRIDTATGMLKTYEPMIAAGDKTLLDLTTGVTGANRLASLQPVLAARTNLAKSRAAQINQSLDETLAGLRAQRAGSGFRGGSTFDTNRALAATVNARAGAAGEIGQAGLDNALATQNIDETNLQLLLQSLDQPFQRGQQRLAFNNLPMTSVASSYNDALAPLNFFRMGTANPPYVQPNVQPSNGAYAGAAVGALGQQYAQYLQQQEMMKLLKSFYGGGGVDPTAGGSYDYADLAALMGGP